MEHIEGLPNILYKYRDFSDKYNKSTLFDFELYLSAPSNFNDPYEGAMPFEYDPSDITPENIFLKLLQITNHQHHDWSSEKIWHHCHQVFKSDIIFQPRNHEMINLHNINDINRAFGILSLTDNPKNYLMWSHYAKSHTGYCIGFDTDSLFTTVNGILSTVHYTSEVPRLKLFESIGDFHRKQFATKSDIWEYENEYRIVKQNPINRVLIYPKEIIKRVYLGCKMVNTDKQMIIDFIEHKNLECEIFELSLNHERFGLDDKRIC